MDTHIITPQTNPDHHTVGRRFKAWNDGPQVYFCDSYDPRMGYWMTNETNPEDRRNVSERAIGRTFHQIYEKESKMSAEASREMPKYKCHKVVHALKIAAIEFGMLGVARITPVEEGYAPFETNPNFDQRYQGDQRWQGDLGYYVVYDDGYVSWSPTKAFEDGYTLME